MWEREYRKPKLLQITYDAQPDTKKFISYVMQQKGIPDLAHESVLDIGSGTGRNSIYAATHNAAKITGIEIAPTAVALARNETSRKKLSITYYEQSFADRLPLADGSVTIALDVMSSNSLIQKERVAFLKELNRVLAPGAYLYIKTLCKDGDTHAKKLLTTHKAYEKDMYIMPEIGLMERVFSREDLIALYEPHFKIIKLEKKTNYTKFLSKSYKRNFWIAYLQKI